jgi:hypothetical protein
MDHLIPDNERGKKTSLHHTVTADDLQTALKIFNCACERLLNPNDWQELCGKLVAGFEIVRIDIRELDHQLREGDYIRINIPGPGPDAGEGYDWVKCALIEKESPASKSYSQLGIKLVACSNPETTDPDTAHFFEKGASSTFIIRQEANNVTAAYYGRNETINNHTKTIKDNIRNTVVAMGAMAGMSELQWDTLLKCFLDCKA